MGIFSRGGGLEEVEAGANNTQHSVQSAGRVLQVPDIPISLVIMHQALAMVFKGPIQHWEDQQKKSSQICL